MRYFEVINTGELQKTLENFDKLFSYPTTMGYYRGKLTDMRRVVTKQYTAVCGIKSKNGRDVIPVHDQYVDLVDKSYFNEIGISDIIILEEPEPWISEKGL